MQDIFNRETQERVTEEYYHRFINEVCTVETHDGLIKEGDKLFLYFEDINCGLETDIIKIIVFTEDNQEIDLLTNLCCYRLKIVKE